MERYTMLSIYKIDSNLNIPIYQQLVDMTRVAVKKGDLASGQQLPTVQELSESAPSLQPSSPMRTLS